MAVTTTDWSDPVSCPFCGDELASPGAGFVDHIHENEACEDEFTFWRENVSGDLAGEWSG
ncbi:DUF7501 family protein [Natrialba taiwanensis]|uniref:Uncharacterized protein n=1 Tax=Natrialba taiwanensis DSM 12281 TaxID=1230458 RepID=L9ZJ12_9EURY|nr:hypothetical protein [Natrialba taiwanensis]ELY85567.1 hypothetical protein C484_19652 [Natrialba taiwanensis DSM 12281]